MQPNPLLTTHGVLEALATQLLGDGRQGGRSSHAETLAALERLLKTDPHLIVIDNLESVADLSNLLPLLRRLANPTEIPHYDTGGALCGSRSLSLGRTRIE